MSDAVEIDVAVIGAGVTGLAAAWSIAREGRSVCLIERHRRPGLDTSTHNSGVIHAGLYYPAGTLKARLCVEGRRRLYAFCAQHGVPHRKCGKLVVASTREERAALEDLAGTATANGVEGIELVDERFVRKLEPAVAATAALFSPESGIVDAEALVLALQRASQAAGVSFLPGARFSEGRPERRGMRLRTEREDIVASEIVNAAGLYADEVSRALGGEAFTIHPCRGEYAELTPSRSGLVNGLVYPLPQEHHLGVHLVKTLTGTVWLGPTVRFQERKDDYESGRLPLDAFLEPAKRLLPGIALQDLRLSGSGIRAKLHGPETPFADFMIRRDRVNPAIIHVSGIESPGLTSCLAIGRLVSDIVAERTAIGAGHVAEP